MKLHLDRSAIWTPMVIILLLLAGLVVLTLIPNPAARMPHTAAPLSLSSDLISVKHQDR